MAIVLSGSTNDITVNGVSVATDAEVSSALAGKANTADLNSALAGKGVSGTWNIGITGNAATAYGLNVNTGRNNEANKVVRTDDSGYLQTGYINCSNGDENNNINPDRVWGTNGSDSYMRTYRTSSLNVNSATSAIFQSSNVSGASCLSVFQNTPAGTTSTRECSGWGDAPNTGWWIIHSLRHTNGSSLWGTQIAYGWENNANTIYQRNVSGGNWSGWIRVSSALGVDQTWQDLTASRSLGATYTNSTGKPIMVFVTKNNINNNRWMFYINGVSIGHVNGYGADNSTSIIIPNGSTYMADTLAGSLVKWMELR